MQTPELGRHRLRGTSAGVIRGPLAGRGHDDGLRGVSVSPLRDHRHARGSVTGAALLALASDRLPPPAQLAELRGALRGVLQGHLGGAPLKSWGLMSDLAGLRRD